MADELQYDVALSFAGEDREFVERVANALKAKGVSVFYDSFEEVDMWGKDLYTHLDDVYQNSARYCVMFISEAYSRKLWTNHERESAQARAFRNNEEYILPVRFDDTEIPGVRPTTGYVSVRDMTPENLAEMICRKLGVQQAVPDDQPGPEQKFRRPKVSGKNFNPYDAAIEFVDTLMTELKRRCDTLSEDGISASLIDRQDRKSLRVVMDGQTKYSLDVWLGGIGGDDSIGFYGARGRLTGGSSTSNAWGKIIWDKESETAILNFNDLSLLANIPGNETNYRLEKFTDAVWDVICRALKG